MEEQKNDLGSFLIENSHKSNTEIADSIRQTKGITNNRCNIVLFQEKRTIKNLSEKLIKSVKCFNEDAELIIKIKKQTWKQD